MKTEDMLLAAQVLAIAERRRDADIGRGFKVRDTWEYSLEVLREVAGTHQLISAELQKSP